MRKRLFTLTAVLSLVACMMMTALWVRSYWHVDVLDVFPGTQHFWSFTSARGRIELQQTWASAPYWTGPSTRFSSGNIEQLWYSMARSNGKLRVSATGRRRSPHAPPRH
jgi:hypothetical protein